MKRLLGNLASIVFSVLTVSMLAHAAQLKEARVTQVVSDVKLLPEQAAPRPAAINDPVRDGTAVRTGTASRTELTFPDLTITRLGANTIFSFEGGTRVMNLGEGAILFQVPKGAGGATIKTAAVTAAITGTTGIGEFHRATAQNPKPVIKWFCLEGKIVLTLTNGSGQTVELTAGQMIATDGTYLPQPLFFDVGAMVNSSLFFLGFDAELPSWDLIQLVIKQQLEMKIAGGFVATNAYAYLNPSDIVSQIDQGIIAEELSQSPSVSPTASPTATITPTISPTIPPTATPSKTGTPATIEADPYVIDSTTVIQTDPSITRNGMTDFGKVWRGPQQDSAFSEYLFGSTSAFDTASGFNDYFAAHAPVAAFKFQSLQLIGNPTLIISAGDPTNLALVGVDGITSGPPGGTLTFDGLDLLLLATQNGSIDLGSELTFDGLALYVYARGANSTLTFDSQVTATTDLYLHSQGDLAVTDSLTAVQAADSQTTGLNISLRARQDIAVGGDLNLTTDASDIANGGNISIVSGGDITIGGLFRLRVAAASGSTTGTGGNITVTSAGSLTAGSLDFNLFFDPSAKVTNGQNLTLDVGQDLTTTAGGINLRLSTPVGSKRPPLIKGGNVSLMVDGNLLTAPGGGLSLQMINSGITDVGTGGNITAAVGGNLTTSQIFVSLTNFGGGIIGTGGNLAFSVDGDLTSSSATLTLDNSTNGKITTGGNLSLTVGGNVSTDALTLLVDNSDSGLITNGGKLLVNVDADLTTQGDASFTIDNSLEGSIGGDALLDLEVDGDVTTNGALILHLLNNDGGQIGQAAKIIFNVDGDVTADSIDALINNRNGGSIGSFAQIAANILSLTTTGDATFGVTNRNDGAGGGTVTTDATVNIQTGTADVGGLLTLFVSANGGGQIGSLGQIQMTADGSLHSAGGLLFDMQATGYNLFSGPFIAPGFIGTDATVTVFADSITTDGFIQADVFDRGGAIGRDALITFNAANAISSQDEFFFLIGTSDNPGGTPGTIGRDAIIDVTAGSIASSANEIFVQIQNERGGSIGRNASIIFDVSGAISSQTGTTFQITNFDDGDGNGGGTIGGNASINVSADTISADSLLARIDNDGGTIGGDATIDINVGDTANITTDATFDIIGSNAATAAININGGSYSAGGTFLASIDDDGTITFTNATVAADVLKAGVFGTNGVLKIDGGSLSADTQLKLYAPGSNGQLNFVANVTLGGTGTKILAANSVTIFDGVVVTIGGTAPADVYTNNANYSESSGGNDSTTGTFAGAGANAPQPLPSAPPFNPSLASSATRSNTHSRRTPAPRIASPRTATSNPRSTAPRPNRSVIRVSNSGELLSLLDRTLPGPGRQVTLPSGARVSNAQNSGGRNRAAGVDADRRAMNGLAARVSLAARLP